MPLGDMTWARNTLLSLFRRTYGPPTDQWAEAYHTLGPIEEALGAENAAAYSFIRAVYATPGLKALRRQVDDKTAIEHVIVPHNIGNVLSPFRHPMPVQASLGEAEARRIIAQFVSQFTNWTPYIAIPMICM